MCSLGKAQSDDVGSLNLVELQGCGFWGELPTAGSEAGAPQGVPFWDFFSLL